MRPAKSRMSDWATLVRLLTGFSIACPHVWDDNPSPVPRAKKQPEAPPTDDPSTAVMTAIRALTDQLEMLTREVGQLAGRTQVLTEAIDDVRCELEWAIRNLHCPPPHLGAGILAEHAHDAEKIQATAEEQVTMEQGAGRAPDRQRELWE